MMVNHLFLSRSLAFPEAEQYAIIWVCLELGGPPSQTTGRGTAPETSGCGVSRLIGLRYQCA